MAVQGTLTRDQQVKEIIKCGRDAYYFINTYVKIQHPLRGLIQFKTFPYQDDCLLAFEEHRFNIVLKSRQLGLSTVSAAYALWLAIFHKEKNILCIATKLPTAGNFIKKVKVAWQALPSWLKLPKEVSVSKSEIAFDNGSQIKAIPTSEDAGRSEALSLLIVDECAWVRDFGAIWTGLYPTLSAGGSAILISTPNGTTGVGAPYYHLWTEAESGQNDFNPIRLPWQVHPDHNQAWFDKEVRQLGGAGSKKVKQELLCDFLASGDTYLQPEDLEWVNSTIKEPIAKEGPNRHVWIWKRPEHGIKYIISADVARGDGADYSTFHILENDSNEFCAEFMGKLPPDRFGELLSEWGKIYNNALISPELNNYGYMTCMKLKSLEYKPLFYSKNRGDPFVYQPNLDEVPGFNTQTKSRVQILSKLEEVIRNKQITIRSRRLYEQLNTFVWNNGKAQASAEAHDDLVISISIGCMLTIGDIKTTATETDILYAIANATSKQQNASTANVLSSIESCKPLVNPSIASINRNNVYRPCEQSQYTQQRPGIVGMLDSFSQALIK